MSWAGSNGCSAYVSQEINLAEERLTKGGMLMTPSGIKTNEINDDIIFISVFTEFSASVLYLFKYIETTKEEVKLLQLEDVRNS